jgi:hypothetical protein
MPEAFLPTRILTGCSEHDPKYVPEALDKCLAELELDYLDVCTVFFSKEFLLMNPALPRSLACCVQVG